jgi:hypothetical protein
MVKKVEEEQSLGEKLQNKVFVNYNILLNLETISKQLENTNRILLAILEVNKIIPDKILQEEQKPEEQREGVL